MGAHSDLIVDARPDLNRFFKATAMQISYFVYFLDQSNSGRRIDDRDLARLTDMLSRVPGMSEGLVFTPLQNEIAHPFSDDGAPPVLALQLRLSLEALEAAAGLDGALQALARPGALPSLEGCDVTHQAMMTRRFPVDDPVNRSSGDPSCSYLVHYPGVAEDLNAWLRHYVAHHPAIMRTFPGVRQIEVYTRVDWIDALPWRRVNYMQRNKLVFDSPSALSAALLSPVIHDMRADFHRFPPFTGSNIHFPMTTRVVAPAS